MIQSFVFILFFFFCTTVSIIHYTDRLHFGFTSWAVTVSYICITVLFFNTQFSLTKKYFYIRLNAYKPSPDHLNITQDVLQNETQFIFRVICVNSVIILLRETFTDGKNGKRQYVRIMRFFFKRYYTVIVIISLKRTAAQMKVKKKKKY